MNRFLQNSLKTLIFQTPQYQRTRHHNITTLHLYYIFQTPQYQQTRHHNITILHLREKPGGVSHSRRSLVILRFLRRLREAALGFCLRAIVNEFHPNHKKTTSSVLSVILINLRAGVTMSKNN